MPGRWTNNPKARIDNFQNDKNIFKRLVVIQNTFNMNPNESVRLSSIMRNKTIKVVTNRVTIAI